MTNDQVIAQGLAIRDEIAALKKRHTEELLPYENGLEAIESYLLKTMQERNEKSIKTDKGTAFQSEQMRVSMEDRNTLIDYVLAPLKDANDLRANGLVYDIEETEKRLAFFTNHIAKEHVKEFIDVNGTNPPGVKVDRFIACHIRKS